MKLVILACLASLAVAAPQQFGRQFVRQNTVTRPVDYRPIAILSDNRQDYGDGNFVYDFETENGIIVNAGGAPGSRGQSNVQGSYRFPSPDGTYNEVRYFADENGFRAESPLIPTPHPLPAHAIEQIATAEEQRRRGIVWE
ncbi:cuticle protein AM1199-like [Panulirus ornatus]|uniref:cuticle protein AM1199-like n=1 Tax=Panulirus ornatus TaxID=150431 RepID=UPI003A8B496C